jgi:hypothetical protein
MCSIVQMANLAGPCLEGAIDQGLSPDGADEGSTRAPVARLTISLPRSLYRQFRLHALELDATMSALVTRLVREEMD